MSRIGKLPIKVPEGVKIDYNKQENTITVTGKFGTSKRTLSNNIYLEIARDIYVKTTNSTLLSDWGLHRTLIANMVKGVSEQFKVELNLKGVGYRAAVEGNEIVLNLGYSHPVRLIIYEDVSVEVIQNTTIILRSHDNEQLNLLVSSIRSYRPPEPYKGKGVLFKDEQIIRKAGKSGK